MYEFGEWNPVYTALDEDWATGASPVGFSKPLVDGVRNGGDPIVGYWDWCNAVRGLSDVLLGTKVFPYVER